MISKRKDGDVGRKNGRDGKNGRDVHKYINN
jgi:hypothetical protein